MPTAVAKAAITGVILSISLIAALGLAVIENPQVQEWLEEQRRRVSELLRQIGEELDPQSRRTAEAFAFEGRTPGNDESIRREAVASQEAAAVASGRSMSNASAVRRIPIQGPTDPNEAEERRRKGREYLARRNQQMYELQQRRKAAREAGEATPPTPTFDELVDAEGNLKGGESSVKDLPSPPDVEPLPEAVKAEMKEVERYLSHPLLVGESSQAGPSGWASGSYFANPFGDEYALERSITPKPPAVPPKIELDRAPTPPISIPGGFETRPTEPHTMQERIDTEGLSYEEQLAIALSLSEQETTSSSATVRQAQSEEHEDEDMRAAIAASLKDMDHQQAAHAIACAGSPTLRQAPIQPQPLVDLTETPPTSPPTFSARAPQGEWGHLLPSSLYQPLSPMARSACLSEETNSLYHLTPELTRARLAHHSAQQSSPIGPPSSVGTNRSFDPVRDFAMVEPEPTPADAMESSFYSATYQPSSPARSWTFDHEAPPSHDAQPHDGQRTPTFRAQSSLAFSETETETFASISAPASRAQSPPPRSEFSEAIEVVDVVEDSDIDMLSEEGDGIATPDSWSEVGSRDADSEMDHEEAHQQQQQRRNSRVIS